MQGSRSSVPDTFFLEAGEEVLGEVEGPVRVVTLAADEGVNGVPVQRAELFERLAGLRRCRRRGLDDQAPASRREQARRGPSGVKPGCIGALLGR